MGIIMLNGTGYGVDQSIIDSIETQLQNNTDKLRLKIDFF